MDLLTDLCLPGTCAEASLGGYPLGWLRAPAGWDTGRTVLSEHLFYLVDAGNIDLELPGGRSLLAAGDAALIPPGAAFRARAAPGPRPAFWRLRMILPRPWGGAPVITGCRDLEPVVAQLVAEVVGSARYRRERIHGLVLALLADLARRGASADGHRLDAGQRQRLERHADGDPEATPRDLARQLDLTLDYFTRVFRRTYGRPPRRWLLERRMHAAAVRVAETDQPITAIATALGYDDPRLFVRQFRQVLGQPPGRFRARMRTS